MPTVQFRPPSSAQMPEALIREARRRQRRRRLGIGLAFLALAAGTWSIIGFPGAGSGGPRRSAAPTGPAVPRPQRPTPRRPIPRNVDTTLLLWGTGPSYLDDLSARTRSTKAPVLRHIAYGDYQPLAAVVGDDVVYVGSGTSVVGRAAAGRPRQLTEHSGFAPAARPGHIWSASLHDKTQVIRRISLAAGKPGPAITLPRGTELIRGTAAGLLIWPFATHAAGPNNGLELWRPGGKPRPLPDSPEWQNGFDATSRLVVYGGHCIQYDPRVSYAGCRSLRVFNVISQHLRTFAKPPGTAGWVPTEFGLDDNVAPDRRLLAANALTSQRTIQTRAYVVPLDGSAISVAPKSLSRVGRLAWSIHHGWLFYRGPRHRLWAYQPRTGRVRATATPCCQYTVMAAVPNPPAASR
jgi:hypothetical protein